MNLIEGTKVYVKYNPLTYPAYVEVLTVKKCENGLLYFNEKSDYYSVEFKARKFYGYNYTLAGDVLFVTKLWLLPIAGILEKFRTVYYFLVKKSSTNNYDHKLKDDSYSYNKIIQ